MSEWQRVRAKALLAAGAPPRNETDQTVREVGKSAAPRATACSGMTGWALDHGNDPQVQGEMRRG